MTRSQLEDDNEVRPHGSLQMRLPREYRRLTARARVSGFGGATSLNHCCQQKALDPEMASRSKKKKARRNVNRFGLSRDIPAETARIIRQECGFGCVICGKIFWDYEHIEPEFKDAREHDPARIALLCRYCHGRVPHFLSKEAVWEARRNPHCKSTGFSFGPLDVGRGELRFSLGGLMFFNPGSILRIHGQELLCVEEPEQDHGPLRISAAFYDHVGKVTARVDRNRLLMSQDAWDVDIEGSRVTVRHGPGDIVLRLIFFPRQGIRIDRLRLSREEVTVEVSDDVVRVGNAQAEVSPSRVHFQDCQSCIVVTKRGISFGEELDANAFKVSQSKMRFERCSFSNGIRVADGASAVLTNCMVHGGVALEGTAQLEITHGAVLGTRPDAPDDRRRER